MIQTQKLATIDRETKLRPSSCQEEITCTLSWYSDHS